MTITRQHQQECLSLAYIHALAGMAAVNFRADRLYDYGFDGTLIPVVVRGNRRVESGFNLDIQVKSTTNWRHDGTDVVYDLEVKTYNDLVSRDPTANGCILVLVCLPADAAQWLGGSETDTTLRHCCYWVKLTGAQSTNTQTVTIRIPRANLLTAASVVQVLDDERQRRMR